MSEPLKVMLLFGGRSGEHEVSIMSARSVFAALDKTRYEILPVGITRQGAWLVGEDIFAALERESYDDTRPVALLGDPTRKGLWEIGEGTLTHLSRVDVVFPVLHGTFGEDGTLQGLLELADVPYVGNGVLGSSLAMDKIAFKEVVRAQKLPTPDYTWTTRRRWVAEPERVLAEIEAQLPAYPLFTKPANLGSSVGISKCHNREELRAGLDEAVRYDRRLLVEVAIPHAREIEVSVLGNEVPSASVPGEVVPSREFYDYASKYLDTGENASKLLIPAPLDEEMTRRIRQYALQIYRAIDGTGLARVDFLLNDETGGLYINEINTLPGFTGISMYPKLWESSGIPYPRLLDWLIDLAIERHLEKSRSERVFHAR